MNFLRRLHHLARLPLVAIAYVSVILGGGALGTLILPWLHLWPGTKVQKQRRCQKLIGWSFVVFFWYLFLIGIMSYRPPSRAVRKQILDAIDQSSKRGHPGAVMVVANHPTLIDTFAIMASYPHLIVMAKPQVFRFPLLNLLLRLSGHTAARHDLGGEAALANHLIERMRKGESVLLFPEATRSPDSGPRPFRRGPFEIALRAGVPVQPIVVDSGPGLLKGGLAWHQVPAGRTRYELSPLATWFPGEEGENRATSSAGSAGSENGQKQAFFSPKDAAKPQNQPTSQRAAGRRLALLVFDQISSARHTSPCGPLARGAS